MDFKVREAASGPQPRSVASRFSQRESPAPFPEKVRYPGEFTVAGSRSIQALTDNARQMEEPSLEQFRAQLLMRCDRYQNRSHGHGKMPGNAPNGRTRMT